jgi:hypothetical protein
MLRVLPSQGNRVQQAVDEPLPKGSFQSEQATDMLIRTLFPTSLPFLLYQWRISFKQEKITTYLVLPTLTHDSFAF